LRKAKEVSSRAAKKEAPFGDTKVLFSYVSIGPERDSRWSDHSTRPRLSKQGILKALVSTLEDFRQKATSYEASSMILDRPDRRRIERYLMVLRKCLKAISSNTTIREGRLSALVADDITEIERLFRSNASSPFPGTQTPNGSMPRGLERITPAKAIISLEKLKGDIQEQLARAKSNVKGALESLEAEVIQDLEFVNLAERCLSACKRLVTLQLLPSNFLLEASEKIKELEDLVIQAFQPRMRTLLELYGDTNNASSVALEHYADDELASEFDGKQNWDTGRAPTKKVKVHNSRAKARFRRSSASGVSRSTKDQMMQFEREGHGTSLRRSKRPAGDHPDAVFKLRQNANDYEPGSSPTLPRPAKRRKVGGDHPDANFKSRQNIDDYEPGDSPTLTKRSRKRKAAGQHPAAVFKPGQNQHDSEPLSSPTWTKPFKKRKATAKHLNHRFDSKESEADGESDASFKSHKVSNRSRIRTRRAKLSIKPICYNSSERPRRSPRLAKLTGTHSTYSAHRSS
jgi:hypothetical protein